MKKIFLCLSVVLGVCTSAFSQSLSELEAKGKVVLQLKEFNDDLKDCVREVKKLSTKKDVERMEKTLTSLDMRFESFQQASASVISSDETLSGKVLDYRTEREAFTQTFEKKKASVCAVESFGKSAAFVESADSSYSKLYKAAKKYSMTQSSAKQLAKTKAREQMLNGKVQQAYSTALASVEADPSLQERMPALEDAYADLMTLSEKIQAAEYKPFIERIKDYLTSIAAVAIILMFLNMLQARISSLKQIKESKKKLEESLKKKDDNIPEI